MSECRLDANDYEIIFGEKATPFFLDKAKSMNLAYRRLSAEEEANCWKRAHDVLGSDSVVKAGAHRIADWMKGWAENVNELKSKSAVDALKPKYFNKIDIVRWKQEWIKPLSPSLEYDMFSLLQYWIFEKYLKSYATIYEFGCGTGHNLLRVREVNPKAELWGLDWAESSQEGLAELAKKGYSNIFGQRFDFFNPDSDFHLNPKSAVLTIASLEQTGSKYDKFIHYLLAENPDLVIHIEPIAELLDAKHPLDKLSIDYFRKRNYLDGLYSYLKKLESSDLIEILSAGRTWIGSFFIEGYSVLIWKPRL